MSNQWYSAETAPVGVTLEVYDPSQVPPVRRLAVRRTSGHWHPVHNGRVLATITLMPSYWRRVPPPS